MVCTWALSADYHVCFPARGTAPHFDLVLLKSGTFSRVQVKRAHKRKRGTGDELRVSLTDTGGKPYPYGELEEFAAVDVESGRIWLLPSYIYNGQSLGLTSGKHDRWLVKHGHAEKS